MSLSRLKVILRNSDCERLAEGQQIIKGVLNDSAVASLQAGDTVNMSGCRFKVRIAGIRHYPSINKLLLNEGLRQVTPEIGSLAEAQASLRGKLPAEEIASRGMVALVLEKSILK